MSNKKSTAAGEPAYGDGASPPRHIGPAHAALLDALQKGTVPTWLWRTSSISVGSAADSFTLPEALERDSEIEVMLGAAEQPAEAWDR